MARNQELKGRYGNGGVEEWPSWIMYLYYLPDYQNYQAPNNIAQNGCKWGTWVTFPQKIEAIQAIVGKISHPIALFRSKDFLAMYKHPNYYRQPILDYLKDKRYTLEQKKIALYASFRGSLWKEMYRLYKDKKIDLELLELVCKIDLTAFLLEPHIGPHNEKRLHPETCKVLEEMLQEIPSNTSFFKNIKAILSNQVPETWRKHWIFYSVPHIERYTVILPFFNIILHAIREKEEWKTTKLGSAFMGMETPPYFLMVMEHPGYYYYGHFGPFSDSREGIGVLRDKGHSNEEKTMAILGMSQLGIGFNYESEDYAFFIENACEWYCNGRLSTQHLADLLVCSFPTFYKYPFFILDYKNQTVQRALEKFIATPTIPCSIKEIARKIKAGRLATPKEMAYMEGYRKFRQTYFTLYETIPPCK